MLIDLLLVHAGELLTCRTAVGGATGRELRELEVIPDGAVAVDGGVITAVGTSRRLAREYRARQVLDASGRLVSPGFVDPHSHLVYAGSRHQEYERLITGEALPHGLGGGIRYTVDKTRQASVDTLRSQALADLDVMLQHGTTTVEAKSGYGLDQEGELRLLAVLDSLTHPVEVIPTYLAAHVLPPEYADARERYVDLVVDTLPQAKAYAEYCDVFCDPAGFTSEECMRIGEAARRLGFRMRVHADQTGGAGAAEVAARLGATSADHLDYVSDEGIRALVHARTIGVLLPGVAYHMLEMTPGVSGGELIPVPKPFLPQAVRRMVDAGMRLALSTDYNPGTSPTQSMQAVMQLAARLYGLNYAEIWHMSTINAAHAVDRGHDRGSLEPGKRADMVVWKVAEHGMVINRFGPNLVHTVLTGGEVRVSGT